MSHLAVQATSHPIAAVQKPQGAWASFARRVFSRLHLVRPHRSNPVAGASCSESLRIGETPTLLEVLGRPAAPRLQARLSMFEPRRLPLPKLPAPSSLLSPVFHFLSPARSVLRYPLSVLGRAAALALLCATPAPASTVSIQGGFGYPAALDASGQPIDAGYEVAIGTFAEGFIPADHAADLPALLANWRPYGITTTREIFGTPGSFYFERVNNDPSFAGKRIYLLLTRTRDLASPAPDASNVTDYGIFTSLATPADPASTWTFPLVGPEVQPPADLRQLNTSQIDSSLFGAIDTGSPTLAWKTGTSTEPTAWDDWVRSVFGENTDPSTIDPDAVSGSSGLKNFVAFALATNPVAPAAPAYETSTHSDGRIGIRFTRTKPDISGYLAEPEASTDLSDWTLPLEVSVTTEENSSTEDVEAYPLPGSAPDKAFFRIQVKPAN